MRRRLFNLPRTAGLLAAFLVSLPAAAQVRIDLERPGEREFIRDLADMISDADEAKIRPMCEKLLTEKATPIIVVTIESMARHGGAGMRSWPGRPGTRASSCWSRGATARPASNWARAGSGRRTTCAAAS